MADPDSPARIFSGADIFASRLGLSRLHVLGAGGKLLATLARRRGESHRTCLPSRPSAGTDGRNLTSTRGESACLRRCPDHAEDRPLISFRQGRECLGKFPDFSGPHVISGFGPRDLETKKAIRRNQKRASQLDQERCARPREPRLITRDGSLGHLERLGQLHLRHLASGSELAEPPAEGCRFHARFSHVEILSRGVFFYCYALDMLDKTLVV